MKVLLQIAIVFQLSTISPSLGFGNAPEYDKNIDALLNISKLQTWILDTWPMPHAESNPSMTDWTLDNESDIHPRLVVSSNRIYRTELLRYYLIQRGRNGNQTKELRWMESLFADGHRDYFSGGDGRFFTVQKKLFMMYVRPTMQNKFEPHLTQFFYNKSDGSLYTYHSMEVRLNIDHEMGHQHQKNWAPFVYTVESTVKNKLTEQNFIFNTDTTNGTLTVWDDSVVLFVYSIIPHRIVAGNSSMRIPDQGMHIPYVKMHSVCVTQIEGYIDTSYSMNGTVLDNNNTNNSSSSNTSINKDIPITGPFKWDPRGQPRGGTPAIRINDTIYGPRYVVIFHSSCKGCHYRGIKTYFMGGYIFDVNPPFAITHITSEPIVPNAFYNESLGWAFKNIDFIAFPMGLSINVTTDNMLVAAGKNDQRGWWIEMSFSGFIKSLKPVKTTTSLNKFSL